MALTLAEAIKLAPDVLASRVINAALEDDPFIGYLPLQPWPGGQTVSYSQILTWPTSYWRNIGDTLTASDATTAKFTQKLKELYVQRFAEPEATGPFSGNTNQVALIWKTMAESILKELRTTLVDGNHCSVAIGATAVTKGIDGVKLGPRWEAGLLYLAFDDTADTIALSSDGVTYGTAVSTASDLHQAALYDGVDTTKYIYLTMDVSDSEAGGDWTTTNAATGITLADQKQIDGLQSYIWPTQRLWGNLDADAPGAATGDAAALNQLDALIELVPGPASEKAFLMSPRTRRSFKSLLAGNTTMIDTWRGNKMANRMLAYEDIPIIALKHMPLTEYAGVGASGAGLTCGSIYLVRFNVEEGVSLYYWNESSPVEYETDSGETNLVKVPFYAKDEGVTASNTTVHDYRIKGSFAFILKNTQMLAEIHGINN